MVYLKKSKEDILSGALKENVIEEGEQRRNSTKRKRDERQEQFVEKTRNIPHKF